MLQATPESLVLLSLYLTETVSPDATARRAAEEMLRQGEEQEGFLLLVILLIRNDAMDMVVRQSGSVFLKNVVKRLWDDEDEIHITQAEKGLIRAQLVPMMIGLGSPKTARIQSQIGEALTHIASIDFPENWEGLCDELVNSFTTDNFVANNGVLTTAHSIFKRWRSQFRTNKLYSEINYVLERFCEPYFALFKHVDFLLSAPTSQPLPPNTTIPLLGQTLHLLVQIFHDLSSQDLPPFFEDHLDAFMGSGEPTGWLLKYLSWERPELKGHEDDTTPSPLTKIRASICEIAELYAQKYSDAFPQVKSFIREVWEMLSSVGPSTREDVLVSHALRFLSVVVKMGSHRDMFSDPSTLRAFCQNIILPNMSIREHEEEMFEDDPAEYIRRDLEPSSESDTRRQAATEFTQALMANFESDVTQIVNGYIAQFLANYAENPVDNWKSKDTAIYLLTSIASRGSTAQLGVTSVNVLVDIVDFFGQNVFTDLQAAPGTVHPILTVDAIKYLYTFRNQLTKDQLVSVLPLLVQHLHSVNYVIYSYAAITIERILFIKNDQRQPLFVHTDVRPFAESTLMALFSNIEKGDTPEKVAENDYLMKCVMRVIITAKAELVPSHNAILSRLVNIIGEISKNPSNPRFSQYCFESVSALIRFTCEATPAALSAFEAALFGPAEVILSQDVSEFIPYMFQILAQLLELHSPTELPSEYQALCGPLLSATLWEQRGNVPALARIWKALLMRGPQFIVSNGQVEGLLGIFQRLVGSKINDIFAFELVQAMFEFLPLDIMRPFVQPIFTVLLNRLQNKPSPQFSLAFVYFVTFLAAIDNVGPEIVVGTFDTIQPGLFGNLMNGVVLPNTQKSPIRSRRIIEVGLTKFLTKSEAMLVAPGVSFWTPIFLALIDLFTLPQDITYATGTDDLTALDPEEAGFQSSFSKLGASERTAHDPIRGVTDEKLFASHEISRCSREHPGVLASLIQQAQTAESKTVSDFIEYMKSNGDAIV